LFLIFSLPWERDVASSDRVRRLINFKKILENIYTNLLKILKIITAEIIPPILTTTQKP